MRFIALLGLAAIAACLRSARPSPEPRWSAELAPLRLWGDTGTVDTIARGVLHRRFLAMEGPWAVNVLDVDRSACWSAVAAKGRPGAIGRYQTSELASALARQFEVAGGINADFFLYVPPGVPTGAHISGGRVVTGPAGRPAFAILQNGQPWIGTLAVDGVAASALDSIPITGWNRSVVDGLAWFDPSFGETLDTLSGSLRVVVSGSGGAVQSVDSGLVATSIPSSGGVLSLGPRAPAAVRERLLIAARARGRFAVSVRIGPVSPREAVGGFPVLVRDSIEVPGLDSAGAPTFAPVRHPRTLVGVAGRGRRLLFITIDGRQPGYSAGTTNRETARIALALGSTEAINLDGGGSTTMVVVRPGADSTRYEVVNKPSDPQGERPVGNALLVARQRTSGTRPQPTGSGCPDSWR
jgi:hypothetical protein